MAATSVIASFVVFKSRKGWENADDWAALVACFFFIYDVYYIFRPVLGEIMDEEHTDIWAADIRTLALSVPSVVATKKCFVRKMGFEFFADLYIIVDGHISVHEDYDLAHAVT